MKTKGIIIQDKKRDGTLIKLSVLLNEIQNGDLLNWSLLYIDAVGNLNKNNSLVNFSDEVYKSRNGYYLSWDEINQLAKRIYYIIDMVLIADKDLNKLKRFRNDREMYETCDTVIEMVDTTYWKVYSQDENLINRLKCKFKNITLLESETEEGLRYWNSS